MVNTAKTLGYTTHAPDLWHLLSWTSLLHHDVGEETPWGCHFLEPCLAFLIPFKILSEGCLRIHNTLTFEQREKRDKFCCGEQLQRILLRSLQVVISIETRSEKSSFFPGRSRYHHTHLEQHLIVMRCCWHPIYLHSYILFPILRLAPGVPFIMTDIALSFTKRILYPKGEKKRVVIIWLNNNIVVRSGNSII